MRAMNAFPEESLQQRLRAALPTLPKAQQQVVAVLLADPATLVNQTVESIAAQAKVSMPSVVRTCRKPLRAASCLRRNRRGRSFRQVRNKSDLVDWPEGPPNGARAKRRK